MTRALSIAIAACVIACGAAPPPAQRSSQPATGAIVGVALDRVSGDPVSAEIRVRTQGQPAMVTTSNDRGRYGVDQLVPGLYSLASEFAGQPLEVVNIVVSAGEITFVDVVFTLGRPDPVRLDFRDIQAGAHSRLRPTH